MFRPATFFCFSALFPIIWTEEIFHYSVFPKTAGVIGRTALEADKMDWFNIPIGYADCQWFGRAPFCKGKCPKGWTEERSASSVPSSEIYFGEACLPSYKKVFCCISDYQNQDPSWQGRWISPQTGERRDCTYSLHGNERSDEVGYYCGSLECVLLDYGVNDRKVTIYQIIGWNCDTLRDETSDSVGTATNGTITWKSSEGVVDRWIKQHLSATLPVFEYE